MQGWISKLVIEAYRRWKSVRAILSDSYPDAQGQGARPVPGSPG